MTDHPDKTAEQAPMTEQADRAGGNVGLPDWCRDINLIRATLDQAEMATRSHLVPSQVTQALHRIEEALLAATPSGNAGERAEPVAWRWKYKGNDWESNWHWSSNKPPQRDLMTIAEPLYAAPPQPAPDALREALKQAERFIANFVGKPTKAGINPVLALEKIRAALSSAPVPSGEGLKRNADRVHDKLYGISVPSGEGSDAPLLS